MMKKTFTTREIEKSTGLKVNTLHYYVQAGAFNLQDPGGGRGTRRLLSERNFIEAVILKRLIELGLSKKIIVGLFKQFTNSAKWQNLTSREIVNAASLVYIVFWLERGEIRCKIEIPKSKITSFSQVSDKEFFESIKSPGQENSIMELKMEQSIEIFLVINVNAIVYQHRDVISS